ncbi:cyclopropane-fatty-acyl-phospholipid synthase family protein [soil metagenome]
MPGLDTSKRPTRAGDAAVETRRLLTAVTELTGVRLPVRLWDGTEAGDDDGFRVVLNHPWSARTLLGPHVDVAAGEAYVWGEVDLEGDIVAALDRLAAIGDSGLSARTWLSLVPLARRLPRPPRHPRDRRAHLRGRRHSPDRDRAAIAFHYDLSTAFYRAFLDEDLVYSCAYWTDDEDDTLAAAQARKLELVCRKLRLRPGMRMLDVGCGWGSLVLHAAQHHGVQALGVTLSAAQAEVARERVASAGLADRVEIRHVDYRDLGRTAEFDAIASVGMVEHVGPDHLAAYFKSLRALLSAGGLLLNHGIVTGAHDDVREQTDKSFVGRYVFPDGGLVPAWRVVSELEAAGFGLLDVEQLRPHYTRTLRAWVRRLEANHDTAVAAAGETDYRIWRAYMAGSAVSFARGSLGVVQVLGGKGLPALPAGRAWMLPGA